MNNSNQDDEANSTRPSRLPNIENSNDSAAPTAPPNLDIPETVLATVQEARSAATTVEQSAVGAGTVPTPIPQADGTQVEDNRPLSVEEYVEWAKKKLNVELSNKTERWYNSNARAIINTAQAHPFFAKLDEALLQDEEAYKQAHSVGLMMRRELHLLQKPYSSMLDKSLRKNVLENPSFPKPPKDGWFVPETWFAQNNDIVRSTLVCKYIDGPKFLVSRFEERARVLGLSLRSKSQQNDDGYYAYHFYVRLPVELDWFDWRSKTESVEIEVQITTQLQEVLRALTHKLYEVRRLASASDPHSWKWEVMTKRFKAAFLGHTLHMLEAAIVELRDSKDE